jgi:hypothetical protein
LMQFRRFSEREWLLYWRRVAFQDVWVLRG